MKVTTNYIYCIWNNQYLHTLCADVLIDLCNVVDRSLRN